MLNTTSITISETSWTRLGRLFALAEDAHPIIIGRVYGKTKAKDDPRKALERLVNAIHQDQLTEARAAYVRDLVAGVTGWLTASPLGSAEFEAGYTQERGRIRRGEVPA